MYSTITLPHVKHLSLSAHVTTGLPPRELDRARPGNGSADQVQKKRKYQCYMAEQYITLESMLGSGGSGAFGYISPQVILAEKHQH